MKIQDLLFIATIVPLIYIRKPKIIFVAGIVCLIVAMPLFHFWIFFTAQKLVEYAFFFFLAGLLLLLKKG